MIIDDFIIELLRKIMDVQQFMIAKVLFTFSTDIAKLIRSFMKCRCKCHGTTIVLDCMSTHCRNVLAHCTIPFPGIWCLQFDGELYSNSIARGYVCFEQSEINKNITFTFTKYYFCNNSHITMTILLNSQDDNQKINVICSSSDVCARNANILLSSLN